MFYNDDGKIDGFLYLKVESDAVTDVTPPLPAKARLKIGTFKINPHGTRMGERFLKKIFDHAVVNAVDELYVTVFEHHDALIRLFDKYGFSMVATKETANGIETVRLKKIFDEYVDPLKSYPLIKIEDQNPHLLALMPEWHSRLLPDSILRTEDTSIIEDISHANSIHKVYLCAMNGVQNLHAGDPLVIYRTSDGRGAAEYNSVATSLCVIEEYRNINSFENEQEFVSYCAPYSVFSEEELKQFWARRNYPHIIRFTYNIALSKRIIRKRLADEVGLNRSARWGFLPLTAGQYSKITELGQINESLIIN